jgi:hypothetical protein
MKMRCEEFSTGSVRLSRSGGGFGAFCTAITRRDFSWMPTVFGNSAATWPSEPTPRNVMSKRGASALPGV